MQVAEQLARIPSTPNRARQHVVNKVAQSLHKVLVFNNTNTSPSQTWTQGDWYAQWTSHTEGKHTCTMYVNILVQEHKTKIRKGRNLEWREISELAVEMLTNQPTEAITVDRNWMPFGES